MIRKVWLSIMLVLSSLAAWGQVPVIGTFANMTQGYQVNGAAPNNEILCGNGTNAVFATTCGTAATLFYQTVEGNGTAETQRPAVNFSSQFTVADSSSPARTNVSLGNSGVTAGTYSNPSSVTVDAAGRTTAITAGSAVAVAFSNFTTCAMVSAGSTDQNCVATASWGTTISGTYSVSCIVGVPFAGPSGTADSSGLTQTFWGLSGASPLGTTSFNYYIANAHSAAAGQSVTMSCIAVQ